MKSKEFGRPGGGVRPSRPPLDPPMLQLNKDMAIFILFYFIERQERVMTVTYCFCSTYPTVLKLQLGNCRGRILQVRQ